jgi:hypothetical protein
MSLHGFGNGFLDAVPTTQATKRKIDKLDFIIKTFGLEVWLKQ